VYSGSDTLVTNEIEREQYEKFLEAFKDDPQPVQKEKAGRAYLKWKCLTDAFFLGYEVLGLKKAKRNNRILIDPNFHRWLVEQFVDESVLMLVPRRHMKTTWVKVKIIQKLLQNPKLRIGLFSVTSNLVKAELASIVQMLQTPMLLELFPEVIPRPTKLRQGRPLNWARCTEDKLLLMHEEGAQAQENQIEAWGADSGFTGRHYDIHVYDDIIDKDTVRTPAALRKTEEWYAYVQAVMEPDGIEWMVGTPYHYSDIYARMIEDKIFDKVIKRACIEGGKPIYGFFTLKMLDRIKRKTTITEGAYIWSTQWMCDPVPRENQLFPPPQPTYQNLPADLEWYISVDPAGTTNEWSDDTAICAAGIDKIGMVYIHECFGMKKKGEEIASKLLQMNEQYKPKLIGIEMGTMKYLNEIIQITKRHWVQAQGREINLPVVEVKLERQAKFERINLTLGSWLRASRVKVRYDLVELMRQMERLTPNYQGKDDLVDAASMIFRIVPNFGFHNLKPFTKEDVWRDWFTIEDQMQKPTPKWVDKFAV